jgi:hypothetical protein
MFADTCGFMNRSPEHIFGSPEIDYSDVSTGYLEDALIESGERSKRRRLLFEDPSKSFNDDDSQVYLISLIFLELFFNYHFQMFW